MEEKYKANSKSDFKIKTKVKLNDKPEKYKATSVNDVVEVNNTSSKSQIINEIKSASVATDVSNEVSSQEYNKSEDFMPSQLNNENNPLTRNNQNNMGMDQNNFVQQSKRPNEELNEQIIDNQKNNSRNDSDDDNGDINNNNNNNQTNNDNGDINNNNNNQTNNDNSDMNNNNFADDNMGMNDSSNIMPQQNYNSFNNPNNRRPGDKNGNLNNDNENGEKKEENGNDDHDNKKQGKPDNKWDENKEKDKSNNNKQDSKQGDKQDNQNPNKKDESANNKDKNQNNKTDNKQDNKNNSKNNENKQNNDNKTNPNNNVANKNNNSNKNNSENKKPSLKDRTKNFAKNQFNKTKAGQAVNGAKEKYESIKNFVIFIKTHPYVIVMFLVAVLILFILLIIIGSVSAYAADEDETESAISVGTYTYYEPNFSQVTINILDKDGNVLEESISIKSYLEGMAYVYLGEKATKEQYKAFMVIAKGYLLSSVNYENTKLNINIQNNDNYLLYCNVDNGCQLGTDNFYYPVNTDSSYTNIPSMSSENAAVLDTAYSETEYYIVSLEGTTSFESISGNVPFSASIINQIKNASEGDYKSIISSMPELKGYDIIDAESTFKKYSSVNCNGGSWLWPSGSAECIMDNGKQICTGTPQVTEMSATWPKYSDGTTHKGIDINNGSARGTNVIASRSGVVVEVEDGYGDGKKGCTDGSGFGNHVIIDHGDGYFSIYGHMLKGTISVKLNEQVVGGQLLGKIGTSGNSTGNHLHFQINLGSKFKDDQNPLDFVSPDNPRSSNCGGGAWDLFSSVLSESDFVEKMETYCKKTNYTSFCNNFSSKAKSIYTTSKSSGVNPELVVVTAGTEQGWKNPNGSYNFWGINVPNGAGISTYYSSLEDGIRNYAKFINLYQDQGKWYYGQIIETNTVREKAGCKVQGHGMPNTLEGMQSLWSSIGTYRYNPGSWGLGGCIYLNIIYGENYCNTVSTCYGSSNCPESSRTTTCEQNDYTAYQVQEKLDMRMKIFGY